MQSIMDCDIGPGRPSVPWAAPPADIITPNDLWSFLRHPLDLDWRAHGIGFIKAYLEPTKTWRLNLYHTTIRNPGISVLHDHPWPLTSYIMAGLLLNRRYDWAGPHTTGGVPMHEGTINCAQFNGLEGEPRDVRLVGLPVEVYYPGMTYSQQPQEIHETAAHNGTATVIRMGERRADGIAKVFWPYGSKWGDASRGLTREEIKIVAEAAIRQLEELR